MKKSGKLAVIVGAGMGIAGWAAGVGAGVAGIGDARAQTVSDVMPAPAAPPASGGGASGAGGYWIPGMPAPVGAQSRTNRMDETGAVRTTGGDPAAPPTGAVAPESKTAGLGRAVFDYSDLDTPNSVSRAGVAEGPMPETHTVRKGDTLWDLSSSYFSSPWYWPKLWALNPLVTNPHWIYPGDVLRLRNPNDPQTPAETAAPVYSNSPSVQFVRPPSTAFTLRQNGYIEPGELKAAATIVGSREEKNMMATLDEVYVEFKKEQPLNPGERLTIYHVVSDVKRPGTRTVIGSIVEIMGEIEVRSTNSNRIARCVITDSLNPIERGFRVGPLRRQFKLVDPVAAKSDVDALVSATLRPQELMGEASLVFLDRGRDDGLEIGNRLVLVRRGDGIRPLLKKVQKDDARYPREVMGEVLIVDAKGKTSTGVVTRSLKEVEVGEQAEARKGY